MVEGRAGGGDGGVYFVHLNAGVGWLSKGVLLILLLFSAVSWAIILYKVWQYRGADRHTGTFLQVFRKSTKFSEVQSICGSIPKSPLVGIFQAGYAELNLQLRQKSPDGESKPTVPAARPTLRSLDAVDRALLRATSAEVRKLEKRVTFLATPASTTPFTRLFGTVWGIIGAFQNIGLQGSTSLSVVAPGIADALVATAAGLFAAVPAVSFYTDFPNPVKDFPSHMAAFPP